MEDFENQLWFKIFRQFSILLAIKTTIVTALCYYAGFYLSTLYRFSSPQVASLWCIISGIIVLQVFIKDSFSAAWLRILGSFIGAAMSFIFSQFFGYTIQALLLCVLCTVMLTSIFHIKQAFRLASLTAAIVIIVGMLTPTVAPFINASARFMESAAGALIAMTITAIFFPLRKKLHLLNH
ncbi:MAG: FUSC family protein [Coxiellaceae bacterium]|nr:FUSC family protein [Coxiellaceae bacterium]